jgi:hypothetical protein
MLYRNLVLLVLPLSVLGVALPAPDDGVPETPVANPVEPGCDPTRCNMWLPSAGLHSPQCF